MALAIVGPVPAEIAGQMFRCDAVETAHPGFQPTVVVVDVLDVVDAPASLARR